MYHVKHTKMHTVRFEYPAESKTEVKVCKHDKSFTSTIRCVFNKNFRPLT